MTTTLEKLMEARQALLRASQALRDANSTNDDLLLGDCVLEAIGEVEKVKWKVGRLADIQKAKEGIQ